MNKDFLSGKGCESVVRLTGIKVCGLDICQLENILMERQTCMVRVIAVTSQSIEMRMYDMDSERLKDIVAAMALAEGIIVLDPAEISSVEKYVF